MSCRKGVVGPRGSGFAAESVGVCRLSEDPRIGDERDCISGSKSEYLRRSSQLLRTSWMALYKVAKASFSSRRKQSTRFRCAISPHLVSLALRAVETRLL